MDKVRKEASRFPLLCKVEAMSNNIVKREYALIVIVAILLFVTVMTSIGAVVSSLFGIMIPVKETLTVLRQVKRKDEEVKHIIVFWMVFSFLTALDAYSSWITKIIPFYYVFKFVFLAWIGPLKFRGGEALYDAVISKIPEQYYALDSSSKTLDSAAKKVSDVAKKAAGEKQQVDRAVEDFLSDKKTPEDTMKDR